MHTYGSNAASAASSGLVATRRPSENDRSACLPLPVSAYEACEKRVARVSSLSLVRYRTNDYSVPTEYGPRDVLVKGHVHEVVIVCGSQVIARHRRSYQGEAMVFDPLH